MVATFLPSRNSPRFPVPHLTLVTLPSTVLRRIKVTFLNTTVRVEHSLGDEDHRVAVEVRVQR